MMTKINDEMLNKISGGALECPITPEEIDEYNRLLTLYMGTGADKGSQEYADFVAYYNTLVDKYGGEYL